MFNINSKFDFKSFINYHISKWEKHNLEHILIDGIKTYYSCGSWSHIRISNTEPIIRLIVESSYEKRALEIKKILITDINKFLK